MPIYEYLCTSCGAEIEVIQRFSDEPLTSCETCSGKLEKKISSSAFHLKGSGWYLTDYARKSSSGNGPAANGSTENGKSKSEAKSETASADSTPAAKPAETSAPKSDTSSKDSKGSMDS